MLYACSVRLIEGNNNNKQAKTNKQKEKSKGHNNVTMSRGKVTIMLL